MNEWVAVLAFQSVTYNTLSQLLGVLDLRIGQPQGGGRYDSFTAIENLA